MENNKKIVDKAKKTLNELGYDVKTTHIYEFFSKMSDYNSYSVAKAKGVSFNGVLNKIKNVLNIATPEKEFNNLVIQNIMEMYKKRQLDDQFFLGYKEKDQNPLLIDFSDEPNALFVGKMGSGKSQALKFTLFSWMLANSHKTQLFIIDPIKSAEDLSIFLRKDKRGQKIHSQVIEVLNSEEKAKRIIDLVYDEYVARQKLFKTVGVSSVRDYEKKTGITLNRILTVICESHYLFSILKFEETFKKENSTSWKLWWLLGLGRSSGIWFMLEASKGTKADIPYQIIQNFIQVVFKTSLIESNYLIGSSDASTIQEVEKGRCATNKYGFLNFPFLGFDDDLLSSILAQYAKKPLKGDFAFLSSKMIGDVVLGETLKELYMNKKMVDLVKNIESHEASSVISAMYEKIGYEIESVNDKNITHILRINYKLSIGILVKAKLNDNSITELHINDCFESMKRLGLKKGIMYSSASSIDPTLIKKAKHLNIEIIDHKGLIKLAMEIDNKFSVSKIKVKLDDAESEYLLFPEDEENDLPNEISLESMVRGIETQQDAILTASEMHKKLGHTVHELELNPLITHIVDIGKPELKIAVLVRGGENNLVSFKHVENLVRAMHTYECSNGHIYTTSRESAENSDLFNKVRKLAKDHNVEIVDYEDWIMFCKKIDKDKK